MILQSRGNRFVAVWDGQESEPFDFIPQIEIIENKALFVGHRGDLCHLGFGRWVSPAFAAVKRVSVYDGVPYYIGEDASGRDHAMRGDSEIGVHDEIYCWEHADGAPLLAARVGERCSIRWGEDDLGGFQIFYLVEMHEGHQCALIERDGRMLHLARPRPAP